MSATGDRVSTRLYNECRCIGNPLRFVPGECFTCGRFLPGFAERLNADEERELEAPGLGALLEAVARKRREIRAAAPRHRHRRVVIEPKPEPEPARAPAGQATHGGRRTKPRSQAVRDLEFATRTF